MPRYSTGLDLIGSDMFCDVTSGANIDRVQLQMHSRGLVRRNWSGYLLALALALLTGCASGRDNAVLGPNPGGGFYCPHNAFIGCAYP
jgi:hypothetical protein